MAINPYELSNIDIQSDILQKRVLAQQKEGKFETGAQKRKLKTKFEDEYKAALDKFKDRQKGGFFSKAFGPIGKLFDNSILSTLLLSGVAPWAAGLTAGVGSFGKQKMARKAALKLPGMDKWKRTFLREPASKVEEQFEDIKEATKLNPLASITQGLTAAVLSDALGGKGTPEVLDEATGEVVKEAGKTGLFKGEGKFFDKLFEKINPKTMKANLAKSSVGQVADPLRFILGAAQGDTDLASLLGMINKGNVDTSANDIAATTFPINAKLPDLKNLLLNTEKAKY